MKRLILISFAIMVAFLSASCERKELLEPGHNHGTKVEFKFDIDVNVDAETGDTPNMYADIMKGARSITIIAYPKSETAKYGVHKIKGLSGSVWLIPGVYDLLIYTSDFYDLDGIYYRGLEELSTAEAYTNAVKVTKKQFKNTGVKSFNMEEPDPLFVHLYENFEVLQGENKVEEGLEPLAYKYWFDVDVEGLDYITSAVMEIDGMYTTVYMADGSHREEEYGTQRVETKILKDENKIKGEFFSFGPHQSQDVKNSMVLTFVNGRTIRIQLDDISPEIKKLRKGGEIEIDQKIVINVGDDGSAFTPEVSEWEEVEVTIPI